MKKYLIAMTLLLTLATGADAAAQKHRHHQQTTAVADTTHQDEVEAYSDTTAVDTAGAVQTTTTTHYSVDLDDEDLGPFMKRLLRETDFNDVAGMLFVLVAMLIVFVLAPIMILLLVFWLVRKNRKDKLRMAEMAMKNGQPIPQEALGETPPTAGNDDLWEKGMRQLFLGIGLMFFLGYTAGEFGFGIGVLVTCMGLGKLVIVKTSRKKQDNESLTNKDF